MTQLSLFRLFPKLNHWLVIFLNKRNILDFHQILVKNNHRFWKNDMIFWGKLGEDFDISLSPQLINHGWQHEFWIFISQWENNDKLDVGDESKLWVWFLVLRRLMKKMATYRSYNANQIGRYGSKNSGKKRVQFSQVKKKRA